MEKLTSILVVLGDAEQVPYTLDKALVIARVFGARIEAMVTTSSAAFAVTSHFSHAGFRDYSLCSTPLEQAPIDASIRNRVLISCPDLVIKPAAGIHPHRRWRLDPVDWRLAKQCPVPLLLLRPWPWSERPTFAAAIDVADPSHADVARAILQAAGFLALGTHGELDVIYSECEPHDERVRMERAVRLAQMVREFHVGSEHIRRLEGDPEKTLPRLIQKQRYDVLGLGTSARSEALGGLIPGTASRLIEHATSDVVLVGNAGPRLAASAGGQSLAEQRVDQCQEFA
jgi:nucleotide-binding universal stress UspA family protein